jgi:serine/threonine protein kinase
LGRLTALKFLIEASPDCAQRFLAEARATAQLSHENIVELYELGEHGGSLYMVLEYVKGQTLQEWLDEREGRMRDTPRGGEKAGLSALPPSRAVELMLPVVRALVCAHDAGIVHRDLKPANIMLTDSGTVKVLDFGIAKMMHDATSERTNEPGVDVAWGAMSGADASLTATGAHLGTLIYMSPEQRGVAEVDHRTDLWAVGILLYQIVTGHHPLSPLSMRALASVTDLSLPMPSVRAERADLGKLGAIIDRCLLKPKEEQAVETLIASVSLSYVR